MNKFVLIIMSMAFLAVSAPSNASFLEQFRNSESREMCMTSSFDRKVDAILIDEIPSILDDCGIGGLIDICGMLGSFGSLFGDALGCSGGGEGGSGSRFCDWGFNKQSAKEAWRVYRREGNGRSGSTTELNPNEMYASGAGAAIEFGELGQNENIEITQVRYRVLGLNAE